MGFSIALPIFVLVLAGVGAAAFFLTRRLSGRRAADTGRCGKCGYAVHGLTTFVCPECGSDLRDVGIETRPKRPLWPAILAAFLAVGLVLCCLSGLFWFSAPAAPMTPGTVRIVPAQPPVSTSPADPPESSTPVEQDDAPATPDQPNRD